MTIRVDAKWDGIERKVVYSTSFVNVNTERWVMLYGYISKTALYEDMKLKGATPAQIKEAKASGRTIKAAMYRR